MEHRIPSDDPLLAQSLEDRVDFEETSRGDLVKSLVSQVNVRRFYKHLIMHVTHAQAWRHLSKSVLTPEHPFDVHKLLHSLCFRQWNTEHWVSAELFSLSLHHARPSHSVFTFTSEK